MPEFNATDYFAKKQQEILNQENKNPVRDQVIKMADSLEQSAKQAAVDAAVARKREELNKSSLVKQLGLDESGNVGVAVNAAASFLAGASRNVVAPLLALPSDLGATDQMQGASDADLAAYARFRQGKQTLADSALLGEQVYQYDPELRKKVPVGTKLDRLLKADSLRETGKGIRDAFNIDYLKHTDAQDALQADLVSGFQKPWDQVVSGWEQGNKTDMVSGLARLVYNAGDAAIKNPVGTGNYLAENIPQLLTGAAGKGGQALLGLTNAGYAYDEYNKGIEKYRADHNGEFPPEQERMKMAGQAATLALAEQLGETVTLAKAGVGKAAGAVAGAAGKEAAKEAAKTSFLKSLAKAVGGTAEATAVEAGTEGYQTYTEGQIEGKPAKPEDIYAAAAIGGLTGGLVTGGAQTAGVGADALATAADAAKKAVPNVPSREEQAQAIKTGDVTALLDTKSKSYSPAHAIAALAGNSELETTTPEAKQANLEKAGQIVADLQSQRDEQAALIQSYSPEGQANLQGMLDRAKAAGKTDAVQLIEQQLNDLKSVSPEEAAASQARLNRLDKHLAEAQQELSRFSVDKNTKVDPATAAPDEVINLSMAAPERVNLSTASQLASDQANGLSSGQRDYLKAFVAARQAETATKDMVGVNQEVMHGGNGNVGLSMYRSQVTAALLAGNTALASRLMGQLENFAQSHADKVAAATEAWSRGKGTQILPVKGKWQVLDQRMANSRVTQLGGLTMNTSALLAYMQAESKAISAVLAELKAAQAAKTPSSTQAQPERATDVTHVSQSHDSTKDLSGGSQVQAVESTGEAASASTAGRSEGVTAGTEGSGSVSQRNGVTAQTSVDAQPTTEKSTASTETTASSQSPEETSVEPQGKLDALNKKSAEGAEYQQQELLGDHFDQTAGKEGDATRRPLVMVKNFLSEGWDKATDFLKNQELTEKQQQLLAAFQDKANEWAGRIQANLARRTRDYWYEDLVQFLITEQDGKLDLDENVKTAMAYAAYDWVAEQQGKNPYNTDEEINAILGRDEDAEVSDAERSALLLVGTRQQLVANALGQRALQALGLRAKSSAPLDLQPKLESQLGTHILKLLLDEGILERNVVSGEEMAAIREGADKNAKHYFIKVVEGAKTADIFDNAKGTQGVLGKLFSVEPGLKEPTREPVKFSQKTTKNTKQAVPSKLAEIEEKQNSAAWRVRQDMFSLVSAVSEETMLAIAGAESNDEATTHKSNRSSIQAKNDGLKRELHRALDFFGGLFKEDESLSMPIFFEHSVWKQQRVGISTNMVNPQTSKIHRHMLYLGAWESEVKFSDMDNFKLRVLEGLGVKTDKQGNEKSLASFESVVGEPKIKAAVEVLFKQLTGQDMSPQDEATLIAGVKKGGENMHSLDALMALAHMQLAQGAGKSSFTVQMMGEVDGVTNGPMLSHLLMGAADSADELFELLNKGGFFEVDNEHTQYNQWRGAPGHFDLYEKTAGNMVKSMRKLINEGVKSSKGKVLIPAEAISEAAEAIYAFTGHLEQETKDAQKKRRNIIKTPLTAMVFGSSVTSAVDSMADKFVEAIYAAIEATAKGESGAQTREELIKNINTLLDFGGGRRLDGTETIDDLLNGSFGKAGGQLAGIKNAFKSTLGRAVASTMKEDFSTFIEKRRQFNLAAQTTFELYDSVYRVLRQEMLDKTVAKHPKTGKPLHDLTAAQEAQLQKQLKELFPVMHTAFSKESNQLKAGLVVSKTNRKLSDKSTFEGNVKIMNDGKPSEMKARGYEIVTQAPGVAMAPMSVHSLDSYISHTAAKLGEVLNVHDAHGAGLNNFEQTARNLNQATWNAMMLYSPASEIQAALSRTVVGLANLINTSQLSPEAIAALQDAVIDLANGANMDPVTFVRDMISNTKELAADADRIKFEALSRMGSIDQYALEGGNYEVTEEDRSAARKKLSEVSTALTLQEKEAVDTIEATLINGQSRVSRQERETPREEDPPVKTSVFGTVGASTVESEPALVEFFNKNPKTTVGKLAEVLMQSLRDNKKAPNRQFNAKLLQMIMKLVDSDQPVTLITPDTKESDVVSRPDVVGRGWISVGKSMEIYVLSSEFQNSGLTPELLLHELVHAAVTRKLNSGDAAVQPYVAELRALLAQAKKYVEQHQLKAFLPAVENLDELVAWGMTNPEFQQLVLAQIPMQSSWGSSMSTALQRFVNTLANMLGFKSREDANGLGLLIGNVAEIMQLVSEDKILGTRESNQATVNLSMAAQTILNDYTAVDIHNSLDSTGLTSEFSDKVSSLLSGIVQKLYGPFGVLREDAVKQQALTPRDTWLKNLNTGEAPFASSVLGAPLRVTEQESHALEQIEAVVRAALSSKEASMSTAYRELDKVFREAREAIKPSDFSNPDAHAFLFKIELNQANRSEHLARFAAFALAHQEFSGLLNKAPMRPLTQTGAPKTFGDRVQKLFERFLAFFQEKTTGTYQGQPGDAKVNQLIGQLVGIEAKRRMQLIRSVTPLDQLSAKGSQWATKARQLAISAVNSNVIKNSRISGVPAVGKITNLWLNNRINDLFDTLQDYRDRRFNSAHGVGMQLLNDIRGPGMMLNLLSLASTNAQRIRKWIISTTTKNVRTSFANKGKDITQDQSFAITQVLLRTGAHVLDGRFNMTELEQLLSDPKALDKAIDDTERQLSAFGRFKDQFIHQANALAYFRVTGASKHPRLMANAHNIARLYGTTAVGQITEADARTAEKIIEQLVALRAIRYTTAAHKAAVVDVLRTELQRTDGQGNGIHFTLRVHKRLEEESNRKLFQNERALMMHGYTPEILNPNIQVTVANQADGAELVKAGYKLVGEVERDRADPNQETMFLYAVQDGGLMAYRSGITSLTGKHAKGTAKHSGYLNVNTVTGLDNAVMNAEIQNKKPAGLARGPAPDLSTGQGVNHMVPIVNAQGEIVNWRYMMLDKTRESVLQRDSSFDKLLGVSAGSIEDKVSSLENNTRAFEALRQLDHLERHLIPHSYVQIGPNVADPDMREIWAMLPDETKAVARRLWSRDGMYVRRDQLTTVFGYRKFSLADALRKDPASLKGLEKLYAEALHGILGDKAALYVARGERIWQDIVHEVKDIIVVKTITVSMGNISSNISLLLAQGVPLRDIIRGHLVALRGARTYHQDHDELMRLQSILDTNTAGTRLAEIQTEVARLQDAINRNPVKELIDAGLMPTIVEDIAEEDDIYSYKGAFLRKAEKYTNKLPQVVKDAGRQIYMAKDTKMYQGLSRLAQVSDFAARYVLYQELTTRRDNPLSKADAIHEASEAFINYDIPMPKALQYTDDMGIIPFMKYAMRIQRVLAKVAQDHPMRVLAMLSIDQFANLGPIVLDSSWVHRIGNNPLQWGALEAPGALDELATVHAAMKLVR